jgi:cytochrome c oxidase subunit 3
VSAIIVFLAVVAVIVGWWLSQQRLTAKPWLEEGALGEFPGTGASTLPAAKIGLGVFLAVIGSLFALLISAYAMQISLAHINLTDWRPPAAPRRLLWVNTGMLTLSSIWLLESQFGARRGQRDQVKVSLLAGGASACVFLTGQLLAWRQLTEAGYFLASNPANSFFYLITGVHGLHVLGGLVALGRTIGKLLRGFEMDQLRLSVELCAIYWHFLLLVWLVFFSLLTGWANDFIAICGQLLT